MIDIVIPSNKQKFFLTWKTKRVGFRDKFNNFCLERFGQRGREWWIVMIPRDPSPPLYVLRLKTKRQAIQFHLAFFK